MRSTGFNLATVRIKKGVNNNFVSQFSLLWPNKLYGTMSPDSPVVAMMQLCFFATQKATQLSISITLNS